MPSGSENLRHARYGGQLEAAVRRARLWFQERNCSMSIKSKVFAASAALALVGGVGVAGAISASAATPSCGFSCIEVFSHNFGTHHQPNFVLDTLRRGEKVGQPQILFRVSNSDPAEDYTISYQGLVSDFFAAGLVSRRSTCTTAAALVDGFPDDFAYEIQYAPYGVDSGLCAASARPRWRVPRSPWSRVASPPRPCGSSTPRIDLLRLRAADQRLGHELLPAVRADLGATAYRPTCRGRSCTSPTSPVSPTGLATTRLV